MKNITMFKWSPKYGFTKFQIYTNSYIRDKNQNWRIIKKEVENIMIDFTHTKKSMKASNWKIVWDFSSNEAFTIRIWISSSDITDLANFIAFMKHKKQTFSTVHNTNTANWGNKSLSWYTTEQEEKIFIPWKWEEKHKIKVKSLKISSGWKNISFSITLAEADLISLWIEKYFI